MSTTSARLTEQLAISRAAEAALDGDLQGGLGMLSDAESAEALDLRARILAQLDRWEEAEQAWAAAEEVEPSESASSSRALAVAVLAGRRRKKPVLRPLGAAALAVLLVGGIAVGVTALAQPGDEPAAVPAGPPSTITITPSGLAGQVDELNRELAARDAAAKASAAARTARLREIAAGVSGPGSTTRIEGGSVRLLFDRGLFSSGTSLTEAGAGLLDRLGSRLAELSRAKPLTINVVGQSVAVPGGDARGGSATALARARSAAQRLARAGSLPLTSLTLSSGDQAQPLFPDPARNRTVSLLLTP